MDAARGLPRADAAGGHLLRLGPAHDGSPDGSTASRAVHRDHPGPARGRAGAGPYNCRESPVIDRPSGWVSRGNASASMRRSSVTIERTGEAFELDEQLTVIGRKLGPGDRAPDFALD